jgi:hypothetical protein
MDVFSMELDFRLCFVKTSEFRGGGGFGPPQYATELAYFSFFWINQHLFIHLVVCLMTGPKTVPK